MLIDADGGELIRDFAVVRLEPGDERLVSLQILDHGLGIGRAREIPRKARLNHAVARHVYYTHGVQMRNSDGSVRQEFRVFFH